MNSKANHTPIVALYLRVSTSQQDHEMQRSDLMKEVEKMGAKVFHEYTDTITGSTSVSERKYASDVIEDSRLGKFQILLVWRIDRIARDEEYGLNYLRRIEETGAQVHFVTQPSINTPFPNTPEARSMIKTMRVMLLMGARMEHENIKARTRAAKISWINSNKWPAGGGHIPDGYRLVKPSFTLEIDPTRAPIIKRIFSLYVDGGLTVRQIRDLLNKEGIPSWHGRPWGKDTIQDKLSNPVYIGKLPQAGKKLGLTHVFTCPPIISDELFKSAQERKKIRIARSKRRPDREHIFRPYVWCASCGHDLHTLTSGACTPNENYHYGFRKPTGLVKYKKRCIDGCGRISEIKLVDAIYNKIIKFISVSSAEDVLNFVDNGSGDRRLKQNEELELYQTELTNLHQQPDRLLDLFQTGIIDKKTLESRLNKLNANPKIHTLEERIRLIKQSQVGEEEQGKRLETMKIFLDKFKKDFKSLIRGENLGSETYAVRREMVKAMLGFINKIDVDFKRKQLYLYTRMPKYLDGEIAFEADPKVKKGRPKSGGGEGSGGAYKEKIDRANKILAGKSSLLVASSNSSNRNWVIPFD